jgi:hypothetical protein
MYNIICQKQSLGQYVTSIFPDSKVKSCLLQLLGGCQKSFDFGL